MHEDESPQQKAIRLLNRQLGQLQTIRGLNDGHPEFKAWRDTTREILERFLGKESHHTTRFRDTRFFGPSYLQSDVPGARRMPDSFILQEQAEAFEKGCATADATLKAAIKHVEDFGVYVEEQRPAPTGRGRGRSGGVSQTFHAPVTMNQAIATDSAVQRIGRVGDTTGSSLKEVSDLLQQSQDLTPRQVMRAVADIEALAVEVEKPEEKRNWKAVLDCGQKVLEIAGKAVDLGAKLAPYTPTIVALVERAKHAL